MANIDVTFEGPITDPTLADKLVSRAMDYLAQGYYWKYQRGLARDLNRIFFTTIRSNQQNAFNKASADVLP